jgi:hypothetical protein
MSRPAFTPSTSQRRLLASIERLVGRRAEDDAALTRLIEEADGAGVPIAVIADSAGMERKTVYRRLGRWRTDGDGLGKLVASVDRAGPD